VSILLDECGEIVAEALLQHVRHEDIAIVTYGNGTEIYDLALECEQCGVVIVDIEQPTLRRAIDNIVAKRRE
jgi:hypothetical protein